MSNPSFNTYAAVLESMVRPTLVELVHAVAAAIGNEQGPMPEEQAFEIVEQGIMHGVAAGHAPMVQFVGHMVVEALMDPEVGDRIVDVFCEYYSNGLTTSQGGSDPESPDEEAPDDHAPRPAPARSGPVMPTRRRRPVEPYPRRGRASNTSAPRRRSNRRGGRQVDDEGGAEEDTDTEIDTEIES